MNHTYAVVIEPGGTGFSAYVPDLPGCVAAASSREAVMVVIRPWLADTSPRNVAPQPVSSHWVGR